MNVGTKSVLFGVHQFLLHPIIVLMAWWIIYRKLPTLHELAAIATHDLGYWGAPNIDGPEGEAHPKRMAAWWRCHFGAFGKRVAIDILGHSRFHARTNGLPLSRLFQPDKLSTALYPRWLYLVLANLSGEIHEYMGLCQNGKYTDIMKAARTQTQWLIETQAHMALMGLHGGSYPPVQRQFEEQELT
ncbi:MAG: hypothetical protein Q7U97_04050 [Rhodocyclaceae bacterium]|nr:hypothetical protein [Rhodocyclaceae bacterium]